jgi:putative addiction module component (TIGR02574 family)
VRVHPEHLDRPLLLEDLVDEPARNRIDGMTAEDLLAAALKLPLVERAAFADRLLRSLDDLPEPERRQLWLDVAERRLQEMREGKVKEIPAAEVFARGRALISR